MLKTTLPHDHFQKKKYAVNMAQANIYALPFMTSGLMLAVIFGAVWGWASLRDGFNIFMELKYFLPAMILGILVHELVHGLTWQLAARLPFSQIKYGFQLKTLTPYAHCKVPIDIAHYRLGAAMPLILVGLLPSVFAVANGSGFWAIFGSFFTIAAGGDMLILWLLRNVKSGSFVEDHPSEAGCYVYENE